MKMTRQLHAFFVAILFVLPAYAQDSVKKRRFAEPHGHSVGGSAETVE